MTEVSISDLSLLLPPPPHSDAPWVNHPILFTSGPLRATWVRAELVVEQQPRRGRKGAIHDLRPLHPPPTVRLKLWRIDHPVPPASIIPHSNPETLHFHSHPIPPPPNAQAYPIPIEPKFTTHFLCFASLFKIHPPTREVEYGRVDRKVTGGLPEGGGGNGSEYAMAVAPEIIERPKSDRNRSWKTLRPHPMTVISSTDPTWPTALAQARARAQNDGTVDSPFLSDPAADTASNSNKDPSRDVESIQGDIGFTEMSRLENYLPREAPKWVYPYQDVTAHLSKRETAGHLIPANENMDPAFYFVFSDLAIRNEGYFSLRFHIVNLDWRVHPQFSRPGTGFFSPLCDCVTDPFAVYSTKEFPGLPATTDFTQYLVRNGVRIRFRDDRIMDAAVGDGKGRGEGRARGARKNSKAVARSSAEAIPPQAQPPREGTGPVSSMTLGPNVSGDVDSQKEAILEMWMNSPGRATFQRTFDTEEIPADHAMGSPRRISGRSSTVGAIRGVSSLHNSPQLRDRRASSDPSLDPTLHLSPTLSSPMAYHQTRYAPASAPASAYTPQRQIPANYRLNTHDLSGHSSDHHWSSISPQSPPNSIPSPLGHCGHPKWPDEEMDPRYGSLNVGSAGSQYSPLMMRPRDAHRYYPYPPTTTTTAAGTATGNGHTHAYDRDMLSSPLSGPSTQPHMDGAYQNQNQTHGQRYTGPGEQ